MAYITRYQRARERPGLQRRRAGADCGTGVAAAGWAGAARRGVALRALAASACGPGAWRSPRRRMCQVRARAGLGVLQGALAERLMEDGGRVVSCCFCLGEHGGECVPGGVVEGALGVFRYRLLEVVGEAVLGLEAGGSGVRGLLPGPPAVFAPFPGRSPPWVKTAAAGTARSRTPAPQLAVPVGADVAVLPLGIGNGGSGPSRWRVGLKSPAVVAYRTGAHGTRSLRDPTPLSVRP